MTDEENTRRKTIELLEANDYEDSKSCCETLYKLAALYGIQTRF